MKLTIIASFCLFAASCSSPSGYKINGSIGSMQNGDIYIVAGEDTLARGLVAEGKFTLTGVSSLEVQEVKLKMNDGNFFRYLFLENETFTVTDSSTLAGGAHQQLYNQYLRMNSESNRLSEKWNEENYLTLCQAYEQEDTLTSNRLGNEVRLLEKEMYSKRLNFLKENNNSYVAACLVRRMIEESETKVLKAEYALLGVEAKKSEVGMELTNYLKKIEGFAIGEVVPDFTLKTPNDGDISLYDIKAKVKIIDFWASWCGPCRASNPELLLIYNEFHDKGLEIFGVALETDKAQWLQAIQKDGLVWKHGTDYQKWNSDLVSIFSIQGIPLSIVLDQDNIVIGKNLSTEELREQLLKLLK